jgi:glycosyltransferase involved in cell wall biosynthesis
VKVLAVNHTALVSGGERSLLTALEALPSDVDVVVACPPGPLHDALVAAGRPTVRLHGTAGSLKLHLTHTPRALAELALAALQLRRAVRAVAPDVVYANSIRAGLLAAVALRRGRPPFVAHVRDVLPPGRASDAVLRLVVRRAARVVANSRHTARAVRAAVGDVEVEVLYSPVAVDRITAAPSRARAREALGYAAAEGPPLLGIVAQLTPWKGQDDAIRALAAVRRRGHPAELLLVGSAKFVSGATRHDNRAYTDGLHRLAGELGVADAVRFLGERDDVPAVLAALDCLLLPSWEEPFGRAIVEGMVAGLPVIATNVGGPVEILSDGTDGLLLAPREPAVWAEAIAALLDDPDRRRAMGAAAHRTAVGRFSAARHAADLVALLGRTASP